MGEAPYRGFPAARGGMHMRKETFFFDSRDGQSKIHAVRYMPDTEDVIAVVQIIHGMAEYIERYEEFAQFLTDKNIVVVGEDHLGHGKQWCRAECTDIFVRKIRPRWWCGMPIG